MRQHHGLGGIGNDIACNQRIFHAGVSHGNAVAHRNGRKQDGGAAIHGDPHFNGLGNFIQIHVAGHNLVVRANHAD